MIEGILPINKPKGITSFRLVSILRQITKERTIGHAGTLDPFATGAMILLIGKKYTRLSDQFLNQNKEYLARLHLGVATDTFDCDGSIVTESDIVPTQESIDQALVHFQGTVMQTPPMFSAKKIQGKKLYELARAGKTVEREAVAVTMQTTFLNYAYPYLDLQISCSKGTYIRSIADEIGTMLQCGAHLIELVRSRSGHFSLKDCLPGHLLFQDTPPDLTPWLRRQ